jgi:hypothetical protein
MYSDIQRIEIDWDWAISEWPVGIRLVTSQGEPNRELVYIPSGYLEGTKDAVRAAWAEFKEIDDNVEYAPHKLGDEGPYPSPEWGDRRRAAMVKIDRLLGIGG